MNGKCKVVLFLLFAYSNVHSHSSGSCVVLCGDGPTVICTIGTCTPATKNSNNQCEGFLNISANATDEHTPADDLLYSYTIDLYNNGIIDAEVAPLSKKQFTNGEKPSLKNPFAKDPNNPFDASGTYPLGVHKICWEVKDGAGNIGNCCKEFEIQDCEAPVADCKTLVKTFMIPATGVLKFSANELNGNSYDNCSSKDKLKVYFENTQYPDLLVVYCEDYVSLGCEEFIVEYTLVVEDEAGNKSRSIGRVKVDDRMSICCCLQLYAKVEGDILTPKNEDCKADILLYKDDRLVDSYHSLDGKYAFLDISPGNYSIQVLRNDNHRNGVTTADLVKIRKYILNLDTNPNKIYSVASDVNLSNSVTAADMKELRQLIIGNLNEFNFVPSWIFIPSDSLHLNLHPKDWVNRKIDFEIKDKNIRIDFTAIKMGDVNGSARASD